MSEGLFQCPSCGHSLTWLDRLAGQRLRCRCGATLLAPAEPGLPGTVVSTTVAAKGGNAAASVAGKMIPSPGVTGELSPYAHLKWPIVIASAGFLLSIVYYAAALPLSFPMAMLVMVVRIVIDLLMLFGGCLIAMRLLDMALGGPLEAIIKLIGVALLPSAIEGLIGWMLPGGYLLGWSLSLGMYGVLLMWFFTLNGKEVVTLTTIVWLVQSWGGLLIGALLMQNVLGAKLPLDGPVGWMVGQGSAPQSNADKADAAAEQAIGQPDTAEGISWLMTGSLRSIRGRSHQQSEHLIGAFYNAHASAVRISDVTEYPDKRQVAAQVIVQLPPDLPDREKVISIATESGLTEPVLPEQSYVLIKMPEAAK